MTRTDPEMPSPGGVVTTRLSVRVDLLAWAREVQESHRPVVEAAISFVVTVPTVTLLPT
jgi:hypothetical protein